MYTNHGSNSFYKSAKRKNFFCFTPFLQLVLRDYLHAYVLWVSDPSTTKI